MTRVVILGGGYGGLHCYRGLKRRLGGFDGVEVTLVAKDPFHTYHGFTGEVLSGRLAAGDTFTPLEPLLEGARFLQGEAVAVDAAARTVEVRRADGDADVLPYDHLVISTGSRDPLERIEGAARHAYRLKDPHEMVRLDAALADLARSPGDFATDVVVVGSGFSAVETAAAVAMRLGGAGNVSLAASGTELLPSVRGRFPRLASEAEAFLLRAGVTVHLDARASAIHRDAVVLSDGSALDSGMTIVAAGVANDVLPGTEGFARRGGRIAVDGFMAVPGHPGVWAVGDAAAAGRPGGSGDCPAEAIWAIRQGQAVGDNVARTIRQESLRPFRFKGFGQAAGLGPRFAVGELWGIQIAGRLAWLLRIGVFYWFMPSRRFGLRAIRKLLSARG